MRKHTCQFRPVLLFLALLLLLSLFSGCDLQNRRPSSEFIPATQPTTPTETPTTEPPEPSTVETTAPRAFNVRDIFSQSGQYTDGSGKRYSYSYILPLVDSYSSYAAACNAEIEKQFRTVVDEQLDRMEAQQPLTVQKITYETYLNGNVLTLYVTQQGVDTEDSSFRVYTFDKRNGDEVPHETLLTAAGFADEESFLTQAAAAIQAQFETEYAEFVYELGYEDALNRTVREDNYGVDMPMYLDQDGHLVIIATIYDLARAGHLEQLVLLPPEAEE